MSEQPVTPDDPLKAAAQGFEHAAAAAAYAKARASYPAEAVAYLVQEGGIGPSRRVVDVGAGTGKLSQLLAPTGADLVAVEPSPAMREQLSTAVPGAQVLDGTGESLPLDDGFADVIAVAQAFHWFDPVPALAEAHRVLHPGGHLFLVWNQRDLREDWVRQYGDLLVDGDLPRPYDMYYDVDYESLVVESAPGRFSSLGTWSHWWEDRCDVEMLLTRTASVSVVAAMPEPERRAVLDRVRHLLRTHPDLADRSSFGFPYTTVIYHFRAEGPA